MGVYKTPFSFKLLALTTMKLINYTAKTGSAQNMGCSRSVN